MSTRNRRSGGNHTRRWVEAVFSNSHHQLQLIPVKALVRFTGAHFELDPGEVQRLAREVMTGAAMDPDKYDYVGTLVAHLGGAIDRGRIVWGREEGQ